jgi:hypothetical protein
MDYFYAQIDVRRKLPDVLQIGVVGDFCPSNPAMRGLLKSTSPEEVRHALVLSIARDIDDESTSVEVLKEWRRCIMSAVACLTKYDTDYDLFWAACNTRETVGAQFEVVYYSTVPTVSAV